MHIFIGKEGRGRRWEGLKGSGGFEAPSPLSPALSTQAQGLTPARPWGKWAGVTSSLPSRPPKPGPQVREWVDLPRWAPARPGRRPPGGSG